jgi:lipoprotein-anchoring transpeptidase ErfK/SrfK
MASWAYASEETYLYSIQDTASPDPKILEELTSPNSSTGVKKLVKESIDPRLTFRVVSEKELLRERDKDRELTLGRTWEILARVNNKATHYVTREIKSGSPMYVPNDFAAYKDWTPLPRQIEDLASVPKFILVVKDIPFLGWYEDGHLIGDSVVCVGKLGTWTRAGLYRVKTKDIDHVSRSYRNDYGMPSPMPYGLRVYGLVWIHGGDIASGYCSHGCINLPLRTAEEVFSWADHSTVVMIVESLNDLDRVMEKNRSNCTLFAQKCSPRRMGQARPTLVTADASQGLGEPLR